MPSHTMPNDYVRVSVELFDNPKLADVADEHGPVVYAVWLHLLCRAKRARHLGRVIASPVRVSRAVGIDLRQAEGILEALQASRSIVPVGDRDHHYQLRNWTRWQSMTPAERVRKHRAKVAESQPDETPGVSTDTEPETMSQQQNRAEQNRAEEGTNVPCAAAEADSTEQLERKRPEPPSWPGQAQQVYDHWKLRQQETDGLVPRKLTDDRRRKIVARLKDGYTVEQLCAAVDGFLADPFHLGRNAQQTRYTDLTTLFKNAAKVDAGLQLAARAAASSSTTDEARSKYVRPVTPA